MVGALILLLLPGAGVCGTLQVLFPDGRREDVSTATRGGTEYISASDASLLFGASRFWRPDLLKMTLRIGDHRVKVAAENPNVVIDERTLHLRSPVLFRDGELQLPLELVAEILPGLLPFPAHYDAEGVVLRFGSSGTRLDRVEAAPIGNGLEITVLTSGRPPYREGTDGEGGVRIQFPAAPLEEDSLPPPPEGGLVQEWYWEVSADSITLVVLPSEEVEDYKIARRMNPEGVVLRLSPALIEEIVAGAADAVRLLTRAERAASSYSTLVVLDPGHGGADSGLVLSDGVYEKDLVLDLALRVRSVLAERYNIRAVLTREGDGEFSLLQRTEVANQAGAGLLLSLHLGGSPIGSGGSVDVYVDHVGRGSRKRVERTVEEIGARYNNEPPGGVLDGDLRFVPWDGVTSVYAERSMAAARAVRRRLGAVEGMEEGVIREGPIAVLRGVNMPALLVEIGSGRGGSSSGSSPLEGEEMRARIAGALADGVAAFFGRS